MSNLEFKLNKSNIELSTSASIEDAFDAIRNVEGNEIELSLEICAYHSPFSIKEVEKIAFYTVNWNTLRNNIEVNSPFIFKKYYSFKYEQEKDGKYFFLGDKSSSDFIETYLKSDFSLKELSSKLSDLFECTKKII